MPVFTTETAFHLPVCRHRSVAAATLEEACRRALADEDWWHQKHDYDSAGPTYVSGAWLGDDAAYHGAALPVPSRFADNVRRMADHFPVLLDLLKNAGAVDDPVVRAAIAKGNAVLAEANDPE
jgi:hypothetical protein